MEKNEQGPSEFVSFTTTKGNQVCLRLRTIEQVLCLSDRTRIITSDCVPVEVRDSYEEVLGRLKQAERRTRHVVNQN